MELVGFDPLEDEDVAIVRALVEEHASARARRSRRACSRSWDELLPRFVKVMPHDYKRALAELAAGDVSDTDDHPVSSGGEGFVTAETRERKRGVR